MKIRSLSVFALLLGACSAPDRAADWRGFAAGLPAAQARIANDPAVDVEHYTLDVRLEPAQRSIAATCRVRFFADEPLTVCGLDLVGLDVEQVTDATGNELDFEHDGERLRIELGRELPAGEPAVVVVHYAGAPRTGLWFVGERDGVPTHVFTQGECEDNRFWFPCVDQPSDRVTTDLIVRAPSGWMTLAAGERVDSRVTDAERVDHWRMTFPHPTYLVTLVAGELEVIEDVWEGVPLQYVAPAAWADRLEPQLAATHSALSLLSELTGVRYPYAKYAQACVEDFPFGGMENISATTMTVSCLRDPQGLPDGNADGLVVHEAAHQWFGDYLTCRDWSQIWLNEGFATYMTLVWMERERGLDEFRIRMRDTQESYKQGERESSRAIVSNEYVDPMDLFFGGHTYSGGATRLHLLRFVLGEEAFWRGIRLYTGRNRSRGVVTDDLRVALEEASGRDLQRFFQQWLESPGFPHFEFRWRWDAGKSIVVLTVNQIQSSAGGVPATFELPVEIELAGAEATRVERIEVTARRQQFELAFAEEPRWVRFDPRGYIPCDVRALKENKELVQIAQFCEDVNGRRDALRTLGEQLLGEADGKFQEGMVAFLHERLALEPNAAVRVQIVEGLALAPPEQVRSALMAAARADDAAQVRAAALRALKRGGVDAGLAAFAREMFETRFSWDVMGAAAELVATSGPESALDWLEIELTIESTHGRLQSKLLAAAALVPGERSANLLASWALDESKVPGARIGALGQLGPFCELSRELEAGLIRLLDGAHGGLRRAAVATLVEHARGGRGDARAALIDHYGVSVSPRSKRLIEAAAREALE